MSKATKAQMVEFINRRCRVNGKKIPKSRLNQLDKEKLMEVINSQEAMALAFQEFIKVDAHWVEMPLKNRNEDAAMKLEHLVNRVVENPKSFVALTEVQNFLKHLPYGTVSSRILEAMVGKVGEHEPGTAFLLLEYIAKQVEYESKKDREIKE